MTNPIRLQKLMPRIMRRSLVESASAATAPAGVGLNAPHARSEQLPRVSEDGAMARALNCVHDARSVDTAVRFSNRYCFNCALFAGDADDEWAGCSIFPGKAVAGRGWCSAWAPGQST